MEDLNWVLYYATGTLVAIWVGITIAGSYMLISASKARLRAVSEHEANRYQKKALSSGMVRADWLTTHGFQLVGVYHVERVPFSPRMVVWKKKAERTYLQFLVTGRQMNLEFISVLGAHWLATNSSKNGQSMPNPPDTWNQTFTGRNADELWRQHEAGLRWLMRTTRQQPKECATSFEEDFMAALRRQLNHVRSLPLWPARMPYWALVRRHALQNKSIERQAIGRANTTS